MSSPADAFFLPLPLPPLPPRSMCGLSPDDMLLSSSLPAPELLPLLADL
jgi:hypothetical protein